MNKEKETQYLAPAPPGWWHEALRNTLPGNLFTPNHFKTFGEIAENGVQYVIESFTKGLGAGEATEGLILEISIPRDKKSEVFRLVEPITQSMRDILRKELLKNTSRPEDLEEPEENPAFLGLITKISRKTAMGLAFICVNEQDTKDNPDPSDLSYIVSITPATDEHIEQAAKRKMIEAYFLEMNLFQRIRILPNPAINTHLKKAILKEEFKLGSAAIETLKAEGGFDETQLNVLRNDEEVQKTFAALLETVRQISTPEEMQHVHKGFTSFEPLLMAGFLDFYLRYCEKFYAKDLST